MSLDEKKKEKRKKIWRTGTRRGKMEGKKEDDCSLQVRDWSHPEAEEYIGILIKSDGWMELKRNRLGSPLH